MAKRMQCIPFTERERFLLHAALMLFEEESWGGRDGDRDAGDEEDGNDYTFEEIDYLRRKVAPPGIEEFLATQTHVGREP